MGMDQFNSNATGLPKQGRQAIVETSVQSLQPVRQDQNPYPYYPGLEPPPEIGNKFDYYRYLRIAVKYRWLIAGISFTAVILAIALTFLMTPIYRATASLQIDRDKLNVVDMKDVQSDDSLNSIEFLQTQYELLSSRSLAERVVAALGLAEDANFSPKADQGFSLRSLLGANKDQPVDEEQDLEKRTRSTVDRLLKSMTVAPVRGSRIVKVSIDNTNPELAQKIANGYAEAFIADNLDQIGRAHV